MHFTLSCDRRRFLAANSPESATHTLEKSEVKRIGEESLGAASAIEMEIDGYKFLLVGVTGFEPATPTSRT